MNLKTLNPWWDHEKAIEHDRHLRELQSSRYVHLPPLLDHEFKKGNLYIIRGPRQIGKTTFLKMLIRKLLENTPGESIFYWSCDNISTKEDLLELIMEYLEFLKVMARDPQYIILDEITGIKDWQKAVKFVIDSGQTAEACFILTGSNAIDLKFGAERLPGRRGKEGKDLFLLPLTFREYVRSIDPEWYNVHEKDRIEELRYQEDRLKVYFERYLITGGIPLVMNEYHNNGYIPTYIYDLYHSSMVGDVLKEGKNEQTMKELMRSILQTYSTPVSWDSLAKRSSVRSHVTIASYIELLADIFVIIDCYFFDMNERRPDYSKNKKLYFYDPFLLRIFEERLNIEVDKEKIIEGIVGAHIKYGNVTGEVHYTKFRKETDFVIDGSTGIEVKYQNRISKEDLHNRRYFRDFKVLSRGTFGEGILPVHVHLFSGR